MTLTFSYLFFFTFLPWPKNPWNHGEAACTGYGDRQGPVAFGLRDLRPIMNLGGCILGLFCLVLALGGEHH